MLSDNSAMQGYFEGGNKIVRISVAKLLPIFSVDSHRKNWWKRLFHSFLLIKLLPTSISRQEVVKVVGDRLVGRDPFVGWPSIPISFALPAGKCAPWAAIKTKVSNKNRIDKHGFNLCDFFDSTQRLR